MEKIVEDQAIIYESLRREIEGDLQDLKHAGFRIESLEQQFKAITEEVEGILSDRSGEISSTSAVATIAHDITSVYISKTEKLKMFQKSLKAYDDYYNCAYSCDSIEEELKNPDLDFAVALSKFVKEICIDLDVIVHSSDEVYQSEETIVERIVSLAYRIMKLEFVVLGDSIVFDKVAQMKNHIGLFESYIREDLQSVNLEEKKYSTIRNRINRINQNGVKSHLVDEKLIQLIASKIDKECINAMKKAFPHWRKKLEENEKCHSEIQKTLEIADRKNQNERKRHIVPKLAGRSLFLAGTVLAGTLIMSGAEAITEQRYTTTYYPTLYEEMVDGKVVASFTKDELKPELSKAQIITYSPYSFEEKQEKYIKKITTYDLPVTSASMTLQELADIDLSTLEYTEESEEKDTLFPSEYFEQDMTRIIRILELEGKSYSEFNLEGYETALQIVYMWINMLMGAILSGEIICLLSGLIMAMKEAKRKKKYSKEVTDILRKLQTLFSENSELRRNFDRVYPFYTGIIKDEDLESFQTKEQEFQDQMRKEIDDLQKRLKKTP